MLDKYSSLWLIKWSYKDWIDICVSNPNISDTEKYYISYYGNHDHRTKLLKDHKLPHNAKYWIARLGTDQHRTELLDHHELNGDTTYAIIYYGNTEHRKRLRIK